MTRRPAAGSACIDGILYECRVADRHRAPADINILCSPWLDDDDEILTHSRYAVKDHDRALNSS